MHSPRKRRCTAPAVCCRAWHQSSDAAHVASKEHSPVYSSSSSTEPFEARSPCCAQCSSPEHESDAEGEPVNRGCPSLPGIPPRVKRTVTCTTLQMTACFFAMKALLVTIAMPGGCLLPTASCVQSSIYRLMMLHLSACVIFSLLIPCETRDIICAAHGQGNNAAALLKAKLII